MSWHRPLLPLTIAAMMLVLTQKAANLARAATGTTETEAQVPADRPGSIPLPILPSADRSQVDASPAELALLSDLRKRRQALDRRDQALVARAELLGAAEIKLQTRFDELTRLEGRIEEAEQRRKQHDSANWGGLVKTYQDMKAADAAAIFNVLDLDVLMELLDRMDERKAAPILAGMLPERARLATQMLARRRLSESAVGPSGSADPAAAENHS